MDDHYLKQAEKYYGIAHRNDVQAEQLAIAAALIALVDRLDTLIEIAQWTDANQRRLEELRAASEANDEMEF